MSTPARAERPSLADLDAIVTKAENLDAFLANEALVQEYYAALDKFFGPGRLTKHAFENIIGQLRTVATAVPEIKERLWETHDIGKPFTITTRMGRQSYSRGIDMVAWSSWFLKLQARQGLDAKLFLDIGSEKERHEKLKEVMERIRDGRKEVEARTASLSGADARRVRGEGYRALGENPWNKAAEAYLAHLFFESEGAIDHGRLADADTVISFFRDARGDPKRLFALLPPELEPLAAETLGGARNRIPSVDQMLAQEHVGKPVFPTRHNDLKANAEVKYDFAPIPRRLHGIFWGAPMGACVGGGSAKDVSPQFWASVAIKDSEQHVVLRNGEFHGVIAATPGKIRDKTYASVALAASDLKVRMFSTDSVTGVETSGTLYGMWLNEAMKHKKADWTGYVLGRSNSFNNWQTHSTARDLGQYQLGDVAGPSHGFDLADPLVKKIIPVIPPTGLATNYAGRMILDATVPGAGELVVLSTEYGENLAANAGQVRGVLLGADASKRRRVLEYLLTDRASVPRFQKELDRLRTDPDVGVRARAKLVMAKANEDLLEARLEMLNDLPTNRDLRESIVTEIHRATLNKPATLPLIEKYADMKSPEGRLLLGKAYLNAGGKDPKHAPLIFDARMGGNLYGDEWQKADAILGAEGMPTPELARHVERYAQRVAEENIKVHPSVLLSNLKRIPKLAPETLAALRTIGGRQFGGGERRDKHEALRELELALSFIGKTADPEASRAMMSSLTRGWSYDHGDMAEKLPADDNDRLVIAALEMLGSEHADDRVRVARSIDSLTYHNKGRATPLIKPELIDALLARLNDGEGRVRGAIAKAFHYMKIDSDRAREALLAEARKGDPESFYDATTALRHRPDPDGVARRVLIEKMWHPESRIRDSAYHAMSEIAPFTVEDAALLARRVALEHNNHARASLAYAIRKRIQLSGEDAAIESALVHGVIGILQTPPNRDNNIEDSMFSHAAAAVGFARRRYDALEKTTVKINANREFYWMARSELGKNINRHRDKEASPLLPFPRVAEPKPPAPPPAPVVAALVNPAPVNPAPPAVSGVPPKRSAWCKFWAIFGGG